MEAVRTAPRPFLTVKEVMILLGCKEDFAYKTMRKINKESESQGYISIGSGKVNKHLFADKLQIPEEDMSGNTMTFKIETTDEMSITITKVRLLDADGDVAYEGNRSIVKSSTEGALIQIDVPMVEE